MMTPFDARLPYKEVAAASLSTSILLTFSGFNCLKSPAFTGTPSIMYKGSFDFEMDALPRIAIVGDAPGEPWLKYPELFVI